MKDGRCIFIMATLTCWLAGCGIDAAGGDDGGDPDTSRQSGTADADSDGDSDGDTDADTDTDADGDTDADTDGDSDGDVDGDTDTDGDSDGDVDGDTDTDGDSDGDTDADTDADGDGDTDVDTDADSDGDTDTDTDGDTDADTDTDADGDTDGDVDGDTDSDSDTDADPPETVCAPPIELYDTTMPDAVVGDGTPASCTNAALQAAVDNGGIVTFNCGPDPVTIDITDTIQLPRLEMTIIDGGGLITLDAGERTRHLYYNDPDWLNNTNGVALQRLVFRNGAAPLSDYTDQDEANPQCAYGYTAESGGGVFYSRNAVIHIIDCEFYDNRAALIGPDVGGGAIFAEGSPELIISGSVFSGNRGSNGGAVGILFGNPLIYNTRFENNAAEGEGMNSCCDEACPGVGHEEQTGAGGNCGALYFDGRSSEGHVYTICGSVFRNNTANELAGALFRTSNGVIVPMVIENTLFDGNAANAGGVSFIKESELTVRGSTFMNNTGGGLSGLWVNEGTADIENSTFYNNAIDVDNGAVVRNTTFVESDLGGSFTVSNSLFVDMSCGSAAPGDNNLQWPEGDACAGGTTFADPELGPIGDNGGSTPTFLPAADGAVEGVGADCPSIDQRGEPRETASCAAGSVEP